jgi:hypothetical protein
MQYCNTAILQYCNTAMHNVVHNEFLKQGKQLPDVPCIATAALILPVQYGHCQHQILCIGTAVLLAVPTLLIDYVSMGKAQV